MNSWRHNWLSHCRVYPPSVRIWEQLEARDGPGWTETMTAAEISIKRPGAV
jgi:hypothetical protein